MVLRINQPDRYSQVQPFYSTMVNLKRVYCKNAGAVLDNTGIQNGFPDISLIQAITHDYALMACCCEVDLLTFTLFLYTND